MYQMALRRRAESAGNTPWVASGAGLGGRQCRRGWPAASVMAADAARVAGSTGAGGWPAEQWLPEASGGRQRRRGCPAPQRWPAEPAWVGGRRSRGCRQRRCGVLVPQRWPAAPAWVGGRRSRGGRQRRRGLPAASAWIADGAGMLAPSDVAASAWRRPAVKVWTSQQLFTGPIHRNRS